jgi:cysteine desulfurase
MSGIYLDYNATTPVDPRVLSSMLPYFSEVFANAASIDHAPGDAARHAVEGARRQLADLIGAEPEEIIFTSGATEANNIAILGTAQRASEDAEIVVSAVEHPAVLEPVRNSGAYVRVAPVDSSGIVDPDALRATMSPRTALVCVMAANNETGAIQPLDEVGAICREAEVPLHVDAAQAAARMPVSVDEASATTLAVSAHKMYGPKGAGALFIRRRHSRARLSPTTFGGGHERNLRPGTLNVPGIVGLGEAAAIVKAEGGEDWRRERELRQRLVASLRASAPHGFAMNSPDLMCLPQTVNCRFSGISAAGILRATSKEVAIATGSACSTTSVEPSHVLLAQGLDRTQVGESLRISFGRDTSELELEQFVRLVAPVLAELDALGAAA